MAYTGDNPCWPHARPFLLSPTQSSTTPSDLYVARGNLGPREVRCSLEVTQPQGADPGFPASISRPILTLLATAHVLLARLHHPCSSTGPWPALFILSSHFTFLK